jgi:protein-tyrosine-phosphatase
MQKQKVLFICTHNSARSQMAAALLNETCGEFFEVHSAGLEPGTIQSAGRGDASGARSLYFDEHDAARFRCLDIWTDIPICRDGV